MAKIKIVDAGRVRHPIEIARDFVREQSVGEWDDTTIERDAQAMAKTLDAYLMATNSAGRERNVAIDYAG